MLERTVEQWLELAEQGPDDMEHTCRGCLCSMTIDDTCEPSAFCHKCAQIFLPLLIEKYNIVLKSAKAGWRSAKLLASALGRPISLVAADNALKELGDA